jgi:acetyl-CoA carboxylase biotin carboxyl carrier protein
MIDLAFVESLIKALDDSSLDTLELERGGTRLRLSKSPPVVASAGPAHGALPAAPAASVGGPPTGTDSVPSTIGGAAAPSPTDEEESRGGLLEVTSPMVGTFYSAPSPDAPPYVAVGQRVGHGTVLCIIEAMKLMNELESEVEGTIAKVMVENAQPVEYGQVLFLVDPS